jgi:hypothetical protein
LTPQPFELNGLNHGEKATHLPTAETSHGTGFRHDTGAT